MRPILRVPPRPSAYSTGWPLTENPISEGEFWRVGGVTGFYKNPRSTPGKCFAADFVGGGDVDDCLAHPDPDKHVIPANHFAQGTIFRQAGYTTPGNTHEVGFYLRMLIGAQFVRGYELLFEAQGSFQVVRWEGTGTGSGNFFTGISVGGSSPGVLAHGDVIRVTAIGSQFRAYKNSVEFADFVDTTFATGNPGFGFFVRSGGTTPENYCLSNFSCGAAS